MLAVIGLISCTQDDNFKFTAKEPSSGINFTNAFLESYVLTQAAASNLGERFTWSSADYSVPTLVTYKLEKSITGDFTDAETVGETNGNEMAVTIGQLLTYATELGLDNDPNSAAPDTGLVYFRLNATVGTDALPVMSPIQALSLFLPEAVSNGPVCDLEYLYAVGAGLPDAGWGWSTPVTLSCLGDGVYGWNVNLQNNAGVDNNFRFFTIKDDWGSGRNYPYYVNEGYTIDANFVDAADGDNNFAFIGTTGYYYLEIDTVNKTITLDAPRPTGVCEYDQLWAVGDGLPDAGWGWSTPIEFVCSGEGVYTGSANLTNNAFRFFTVKDDWGSGRNYPYYLGEGYTIDAAFEDALDGDNNFKFIGTPGTYFLTLDTVAKTITLE